ncbi:MAG: VCBS repeat-containing protein [Planctomycetes bacterium]|nr:VCBS repeat-containing protein [Planctomycetota bacterium]
MRYRILVSVVLLAAQGAVSAAERDLSATVAQIIEGIPQPAHIAIGDLNGDGKPDLALGGIQDGKGRVLILHQKGSKFAAPADREIALPSTPSGLVVADFDKDGKNDLAVGLRGKRRLSLYLGSENLGKEHPCDNVNDSAGGGLSWGRINKAGLADFVTGGVWRKWLGGDQFQTGYFKGPEKNDNFTSRLEDMSGSGLDDVLFLTADNQVRIYYGPFLSIALIEATEAMEVVTLKTPFSPGAPYAELAIGDLNGDRQPDLVVFRQKTKDDPIRALVYLQNSPTGFTNGAGPSFALEGVAGPLVLADLNGDKLCDMAACQGDQRKLCVFFQKKGRPFASRADDADDVLRLPDSAACVAAGDVDQDGVPNLIVGMRGGNLAILRSLGSRP